MTTAAFMLLRPKIAAALTEIKLAHCAPPAYKPAADVVASTKCPHCRSTLAYSVSAATGSTSGRCTAACGVRWDAQ